MANLRKVIYINEEDYSTLINGDSLVIDGTTYTYEENALYVIKNAGPPEYAETAGYATNAGTSLVAVTDANGNNIVATYGKKPLIIEIERGDASVQPGTYNNIKTAIADKRNVIVKYEDGNEFYYLPLIHDGDLVGDPYLFCSSYEYTFDSISIYDDDTYNYFSGSSAPDDSVVHISDSETITGNKTFTGTVSLGSNATATTPAATDNDTSVATTAFVKTVVANSINELPSPMVFKGSLGTGGTITSLPAATTSNEGYTYKVITNGTYGGQSAKIGDTFISDGSNWIYIPSGDEPSGTVTNVKIQATSPIAIDDSSAITTSGTRTISHNDSGVTAGTYKSVTVDAKGHVIGGTNPTTLAGYGITDAVTLDTEQTITGLKTLGLYGDERHTYNVCNFYLRTTFKHVVLYTNLPYSSGSFMPVITLKGFLYSTTDLESKITFYIYNNEFYTPKVLHLGAASPIVYLFTYSDNGTERVAVGLEGNFYYLGFQVDIHFPALGEAYKPKSLWTFNTDNVTYDSTITEENRIIPSIGINHCVRCGINSLGTTTTGNIAKIGSSTDNAVVRFDGTTSAVQNSGVIIDDNNNLTANSFKKTGGTSSQFLKADGSVDSNTYLTSYTETDPTVPSHVKAITIGNISDWNNKLDEAYYVVNVTSDSQINHPSTVSGSSNYYALDIVTAYNSGKIPIAILNQEIILPFIANDQTNVNVLFGITVNLRSYLIIIGEDSVEIKSQIGISEEDIPITQIQINGSTLIPDSQVVDITSIPASIIAQNSLYKFVTDTEKSKINSAIQSVKVNGTSITPDSNKVVDITIPGNELSSAYLRSILENEDLLLEVGDSYEEAFGKLEKAIIDDEETVAAALNELNDKIKDVDTELDEESENPVQNKAITLAILDNEYVVSVALNNLNDRIQAKQDTLISGTNIKTINGTSILGSGNINVSGGSGTGGGGDENVIETIKVNGTALTPDANKAVNIDLSSYDKAPLIIEIDITDTTVPSGTYTNIGNALANGREVYIKMNGDNYSVYYLKLCDDLSRGRSECYAFSSDSIRVSVWSDNTLSIESDIYAAYEHEHGDINNDGTLSNSTPISIANGDRIVITDASSNEKIQKTSITFDGSTTTTALTPKGTWETFLKTAPVTSVNGQTGAVSLTLGQTNVIETVKVNGTALTPDANKAVNITSVPAGIVTQDATHRFVSDTEKTTWNGKQNALTLYRESSGDAYIETYALGSGEVTLGCYDDTTNDPVGEVRVYNEGVELKYKDLYTGNNDEIENTVTLSHDGFKFNNKQIATVDQIPSTITESTVSGWGFTKNAGTITGITMNGASKGTSGVVNLGTVLTSETSLSKGTTSGSGNAVTDISVSGHTITLTKGSTFLTSHQNIKTINNTSLVGTGNVSIDTLPTVTSSDNGKILQVVNGAWALVTPTAIYSGTSTPNNSTGNDGDLYLQTS